MGIARGPNLIKNGMVWGFDTGYGIADNYTTTRFYQGKPVDNMATDPIFLNSTAGTGHFYTTTKNKRTMTEKMEIMKFDPKARKHVLYKENKIK